MDQYGSGGSARRSHRIGVALIEVVVCIGISGVLIGMMLSAVLRVRESAARTRCQSNLRQVGLALHQYHGTKGVLPPGISVHAEQGRFPYLGWTARILPYIEYESLWREIEVAFSVDPDFLSIPPHTRRGEIIPLFCCPSDSSVWESGLKNAFTSYLGVEGTDQFKRDGVLFLDSRTRFGDVVDGTSHTLMAGERPPSPTGALGWWYAGWGQRKDGSAEMLLGVREYNEYDRDHCPPGPYHFAPGRFGNRCDTYHFWSPHFGGSHFLFVDGSVRFLRYSVDAILPSLATRQGGEADSVVD